MTDAIIDQAHEFLSAQRTCKATNTDLARPGHRNREARTQRVSVAESQREIACLQLAALEPAR
jgi:hypothetical protein